MMHLAPWRIDDYSAASCSGLFLATNGRRDRDWLPNVAGLNTLGIDDFHFAGGAFQTMTATDCKAALIHRGTPESIYPRIEEFIVFFQDFIVGKHRSNSRDACCKVRPSGVSISAGFREERCWEDRKHRSDQPGPE